MEYDELLDVMKRRRSCRSFQDKCIDDEQARRIIEAGLWTASAHNLQETYIVRVKNDAVKNAIKARTRMFMFGRENAEFDPFYGAPEIFVVFSRYDTAHFDGSLAMENMMLAVETLGLGSCWINTAQIDTEIEVENSVVKRIAEQIGVDTDHIHGVGYLAVGYKKDRDDQMIPRKENRSFTIG